MEEYCVEKGERYCLTSTYQRHDDPSAVVKILVHEIFHHVQYEIREELSGLEIWHFPYWFREGGPELVGGKVNPNPDLAFESLLDTIEKERNNTVSCCWGLSTQPTISFSGVYRQPWVFLAFAEEHCGDDFYKNILMTNEETFEEAWTSEIEACGETTISLFHKFQGWFDEKRPSEEQIARVPKVRGYYPPRTPTRIRRIR